MKPSKLGKGLSALFEETALTKKDSDSSRESRSSRNNDSGKESSTEGNVKFLSIQDVHPGSGQPRTIFDQEKLQELADSIRENGLLQPIIVQKRAKGDGYSIIAGERRWRACKLLRMNTIEAVIREATEQCAAELALIENIQRENLNPIEEAVAYKKLIEIYGYTQETLAGKVGKSRPHVGNSLRLLQLSEGALSLLREGMITAGHARALLGHEEADRLAKEAADKGLSVRDVEKLAQKKNLRVQNSSAAKFLSGKGQRAKNNTELSGRKMPAVNSDLSILEQTIADALSLPVHIRYEEDGKGRVELCFNNLEDLDVILLACETYAEHRSTLKKRVNNQKAIFEEVI